MVAVVTVIVLVMLSIIVVRIGGAALTLTGLAEDAARFQALSAFTGTGFTTGESEQVLRHPVRRRIVALLMWLGNAGIVSTVGSLFLSFSGVSQQHETARRLGLIVVSVLFLWLIARSQWLDKRMSRAIRRAMLRWTTLDTRDHVDLLELENGYAVAEVFVERGSWLADRTLGELQLSNEGINVVGVRRADAPYLGCPVGETLIHGEDVLLLYGRRENVDELESRVRGWEGDRRHEEAVQAQQAVVEAQTHASDDADEDGDAGGA